MTLCKVVNGLFVTGFQKFLYDASVFCDSRMAKINHIVGCFVFLALVSGLAPSPAQAELLVKDIRLGAVEGRTRVVVELSEDADYKLFTLSDPYRAVINLPETKWEIPESVQDKGLVSGVRFGAFEPGVGRIVVDLRGPVNVDKHFILPPGGGFENFRLVVDFEPATLASFRRLKPDAQKAPPPSSPPPSPKPRPGAPTLAGEQPSDRQFTLPTAEFTPKPRPRRTRKTVVIDPGHGGVDPGAQGIKAWEKNIVLAFSKEFARQLKATGRYDVHLTRSTDVYIPLRQRVRIARDKEADLFISIHADAIRKKHIRGLSIYTLSEKASDREAAELAAKENRSDIIAGMDFEDELPEVTDILIDLAQRGTKNASVKFANQVVEATRGKTLLLERTHRFAGFRVLKAPDVPSVLVELGFITNRTDEKQLASSKWRRKVASGLVEAVDTYFAKNQGT